MTSDEPKRRGRPPVAKEDRKTGNLTFRTRANLREQLEEAAQQSGRSVSEEIEYRLQQSFDRNALALQMYGSKNTDLMRALSYLFSVSRGMEKFSNASVYLAAITTIMAYGDANYKKLIEDNIDPSIWQMFSRLGVAQACNVDLNKAEEIAERLVPEMANLMAEYREGAEMARRLKKEKTE